MNCKKHENTANEKADEEYRKRREIFLWIKEENKRREREETRNGN